MVKLMMITALAGCVTGLDAPAPAAALDRDYFRCNVQPVLAARCAFPACHGNARRPLALYAVGRMRYGVGWDQPTAPLTDQELGYNFDVATGFTTTTATGQAWLLAKPLTTDAGGYYHRGADLYGAGNVFDATTDRGYQQLAAWIVGETASASCAPTTEVGP